MSDSLQWTFQLLFTPNVWRETESTFYPYPEGKASAVGWNIDIFSNWNIITGIICRRSRPGRHRCGVWLLPPGFMYVWIDERFELLLQEETVLGTKRDITIHKWSLEGCLLRQATVNHQRPSQKIIRTITIIHLKVLWEPQAELNKSHPG